MSEPNDSPQSSTLFSTLPGQFPQIESHDRIKTQEFLDAASGVVIIVEKLGKAFAPVISDMNGNIRKIADKYEENTEENEFIENMILEQNNRGDRTAIDGLQWLRRGLHFASRFFQMIIDDAETNTNSQALTPLLRNAYRETLERYHGWLGSQLFNILSRFTPTKRQFFFTLALEHYNRDESVLRDMQGFTERMYCCVRKLEDFYLEHGLETHERV